MSSRTMAVNFLLSIACRIMSVVSMADVSVESGFSLNIFLSESLRLL